MQPQTVTVIAYGSLMSGLGLAGLGHLPVVRAAPARLHNARRGFGKLSQYGDRYAMALEPLDARAPMTSDGLRADEEGDGVDTLALTMSLDNFTRVAAREGYQAAAVFALAERAAAVGVMLSEHLWHACESAGFDLVGYRRRLVEMIGYTSAHYIPHPVRLAEGEIAVTFLAPGSEGSGRDDVIPVRVATGMTQLLSFADAWRHKPTASQLDYFAMCLLAERHGLSLADVLDDLDDELTARLRRRLEPELAIEPERFRATLGLSAEAYATHFGRAESRTWFGSERVCAD